MFREGKAQNIIDSIAKQSPSRRLGEPDDIAPLVGFLASPGAQWITGQNIRVNGVCDSYFTQVLSAEHMVTGICGLKRGIVNHGSNEMAGGLFLVFYILWRYNLQTSCIRVRN